METTSWSSSSNMAAYRRERPQTTESGAVLWSARHRAYDREQWRDIVETATLLYIGACYIHDHDDDDDDDDMRRVSGESHYRVWGSVVSYRLTILIAAVSSVNSLEN